MPNENIRIATISYAPVRGGYGREFGKKGQHEISRREIDLVQEFAELPQGV
jgi:hypothetical protein